MKAKMVCSRIIWERNRGTITYPIREESLMMKRPNKMKVVSPPNNNTVIINGEKLYIITPTVKTMEVDLLKEIGTSGVISKMDFYYNLSEFLESHNVLIKEYQPNNMYILEITSKGEDRMWDYSKMIMHIDYRRGLDIKKEIYLDKEDLSPSISHETLESQLINEIWIPTKTVEKSFFVDGVIEEITTFSEIQLNIEISDSEFVPHK
jgi:outer membrane lipoprotein-sorting protein